MFYNFAFMTFFDWTNKNSQKLQKTTILAVFELHQVELPILLHDAMAYTMAAGGNLLRRQSASHRYLVLQSLVRIQAGAGWQICSQFFSLFCPLN